MEIRNNAEALKAFLGVSSPASTQAQQTGNQQNNIAQAGFAGDQATLATPAPRCRSRRPTKAFVLTRSQLSSRRWLREPTAFRLPLWQTR